VSPTRGLAEPPEGALAGESVPRENEEEERRRAAVEQLVGAMKGHPRYEGRSDAELEDAAHELIERYGL